MSCCKRCRLTPSIWAISASLLERITPAPSGHGPAYGCPPWCEVQDHDSNDGMPGWTGFTGIYTHSADRSVRLASLLFRIGNEEHHQTAVASVEDPA